MIETCNRCDREIVNIIPEGAGTAKCGGYDCGHVRVYILEKQNCRQVILRDDVKS